MGNYTKSYTKNIAIIYLPKPTELGGTADHTDIERWNQEVGAYVMENTLT